MNRRDFLSASAATASLSALALPRASAAEKRPGAAREDPELEPLIAELVAANDTRVQALLAKQERRAGQRWLGGLPNEHGIFTVHGTTGLISAAACALASPKSRYSRAGAEELIAALGLAARYLLAAQHKDGTVDLISTNFHSPPDLAFVLEVVCPAFVLLREGSAARLPGTAAVLEDLGTFIRRAAGALRVGGVHTPNHRWVVCAGLAWAQSLFPEPGNVTRVEQWLAEGIDIDPDGQYTEKSTTIYSPIVDRALITVARLLNRPALLEPVRRNLEMTLYYIHPDGEIVTEASRRQDRYQRGSMARYYYAYRWMAVHDGNGRFAAITRQIERDARQQIAELPALLLEAELRRSLPAAEALPTDYAKVFLHSSLARVRRGNASATILANNPTLFSFRKGAAALEAVRVASAFFGKGQFEGAELVVRDGGYLLRQELDGPYFQPLTAEQVRSGEHVRMAPNGTLAPGSKALRARSEVQTLVNTVGIREIAAGAFELTIAVRGTDGVPVAVELAFRHGGQLEGVEPVAGMKNTFLLREPRGRYTAAGETIEFGPGRAEHSYTQIRGALPAWDGQCVYLTGFTPFEVTVRIS
jgi:hypothetical protein